MPHAHYFNSRRDRTGAGMRLTFRKLNGIWFLEWHPASTKTNGAPIQRRKAHDTEVELIRHIRDLETQLSGARRVADLKLRSLTGTLKKVTPK